MSEFCWMPYHTFGDIAKAFIDNAEGVYVIFTYDFNLHRYCLSVHNSGLYLRDIRCWLPDNITVKYGDTQDVIVFVDSNVQ